MDNLTDEMKIACCKACLLSQAMKGCDKCPFRIGLVYRALDHVKDIKADYPPELKEKTIEKLLILL